MTTTDSDKLDMISSAFPKTPTTAADSKHARRDTPLPLPFLTRKSSQTLPTFRASLLLPEQPDLGRLDSRGMEKPMSPAFGAPLGAPATISRPGTGTGTGTVSPPSVFDDDNLNHHDDHYTEPTTAFGSGLDEPGSYDLKPPPPSVSHSNVESLALRLFSVDHLDIILKDPDLAARFRRFVNQHRSQHASTLAQYFETKKAAAAVEYANAVAENLPTAPGHPPYIAATIDERFESRMRETVEDLVEDALPAYLTHRLVQIVTESLVKEVTGNNAPIMRELIPSLAEVYCITDPSLPDNPIVYASQEFYNTSQYGRDYTIGRNCRFLQGPKTSNQTVRRMIDALTTGQEITETILNYRRDGSPFLNLLMIAPLYDNKGQVRYFLGCQIDVSPLIEGGRGLESFAQLLSRDRSESRFGNALEKDPKHMLGEFGQVLTEEEANLVKSRSRRYSEESARPSSAGLRASHEPRRRIGMDDDNNNASDRNLWPHPSLGPSGRLPGVYQNYLLVRPYPSLRVTFTSPALRIPGLLQTKFLDRIGGPTHVRDAILDSLAHGTGVTAKISWITSSAALPPPQQQQYPSNGGGTGTPQQRASVSVEGKPRWIHCTPLLGSDEKVGVWMVVMVDQEEITGQLNRNTGVGGRGDAIPASPGGVSVSSPRFTGNKLYAEYLRREGRPVTPGSVVVGGGRESLSAARERREVDGHFRDF